MPRRRIHWSKLLRWTARAAAIAWLLAVGVLWVHSLYFVHYCGFEYYAPTYQQLVRFGFDVHLGRGEVGFSRGHELYPEDEKSATEWPAWRWYWRTADKPTRPPFHARPETLVDALGFGKDDITSWRQRTVGVVVPLWLLMLPAAIVAVRWAARARRSHLRQRLVAAGRCGNCGYDLRATPGRCSECGAEASGQP